MRNNFSHLWPSVPLALGSKLLFGGTAPLSKLLLGQVDPQMSVGLLYLGAGIGLAIVHSARAAVHVPAPEAPLRRTDLPWLAVVILFGGVMGPLLLMLGLSQTSAASGSLLLNLEGIFTPAIAWTLFRENVDRRLILGAVAIILGAVILSWTGKGPSLDTGAALITAACLCWGIDNNLTRKISSADPVQIAMAKGPVAGAVNLTVGFVRGATLPSVGITGAAAAVGFFGVGVSLVLFVLALRHLGAARTAAYFPLAPFVGAAMAIGLLDEPLSAQILLASALMAGGLRLHPAERHDHDNLHEAMEHEHSHTHDTHHQHTHDGPFSEPYSHWHRHEPRRHSHPHYPDLLHRHGHEH